MDLAIFAVVAVLTHSVALGVGAYAGIVAYRHLKDRPVFRSLVITAEDPVSRSLN